MDLQTRERLEIHLVKGNREESCGTQRNSRSPEDAQMDLQTRERLEIHLVKGNREESCGTQIGGIEMEQKRLTRSRNNKMICGVCGGIGEYLNIDPTLVRLVWAILTVGGFGSGLLVYIIAAIVVPEEYIN